MNRNKKIGILLAAVIAAGIPIAGSVYSEQVKLVSKGAISYDEDGDGVEETLIDSEDLDRLMVAINEAASSQSSYASKLEELQKDLEQNRLDTDKANDALIKDKAGLVEALHSKFPGVELIDKLTEKASFEDIIAAVDSLASPSSAKINYGDYRNKSATSSITSGSQTINITGTPEINLDKNQQLVLPRGYYGSDMTINNVISGNTLNWNPSGIATMTINQAYTSGTISTSNAYEAGRQAGWNSGRNDGYAEGVKASGGITIKGWGYNDDKPGVTEFHVYPGWYQADFVFKTFAKYVPGYKLYLNNTLWQTWQAKADEANKGDFYSIRYYVPYEATLRCEAYSSNNTGMVFLHGAFYRSVNQ